MGSFIEICAAVFLLTNFIFIACGLIARFHSRRIISPIESARQAPSLEEPAGVPGFEEAVGPACISLYGHDLAMLAIRAKLIETGGFRTCTVHNEIDSLPN